MLLGSETRAEVAIGGLEGVPPQDGLSGRRVRQAVACRCAPPARDAAAGRDPPGPVTSWAMGCPDRTPPSWPVARGAGVDHAECRARWLARPPCVCRFTAGQHRRVRGRGGRTDAARPVGRGGRRNGAGGCGVAGAWVARTRARAPRRLPVERGGHCDGDVRGGAARSRRACAGCDRRRDTRGASTARGARQRSRGQCGLARRRSGDDSGGSVRAGTNTITLSVPQTVQPGHDTRNLGVLVRQLRVITAEAR